MSKAFSSASFRALGTTTVVVVTRPGALAPAREALEQELRAVDKACSRFRGDSDLTRLNEAGGELVPVGSYLLDALQRAKDAAEGTFGLVDPTLGRALRLAGYDRTFALVKLRDGRGFRPSTAPGGAWPEIEVDRRRGLARIPRGVELDLGATAKALAADRAAAAAAARIGTGVLVGLGGDVAVAGEPPARGWSVGLADDHAENVGASGPAVAISSGGLATSGTRVRHWSTAAGSRHHLIDPRTGTSAVTPWRTVSVAAASCLDANTASTAAIVLGAEAPSWLEQRKLPARLVRDDGWVTVTGGWPE